MDERRDNTKDVNRAELFNGDDLNGFLNERLRDDTSRFADTFTKALRGSEMPAESTVRVGWAVSENLCESQKELVPEFQVF